MTYVLERQTWLDWANQDGHAEIDAERDDARIRCADAPRLTAVDIFCGIGGFHIAATQNGIDVTFASEIDAAAAHCYEENLKLKPQGDIRQCKGEIPAHDILMAGFPCQPFSIMGKGHGLDDAAQGRLVFEVLEIAEQLRPSAVVLENVKRFATHAKGKTIGSVIQPLERRYDVHVAILNALDFGLPQKRERTFIVALEKGAKSMTWPKPQECAPDLSSVLEEKVDARYYANPRIRANRRRDHQAKHRPAIWHENRSGQINSHPYCCSLRAGSSHNYLLVDGERRLTERELLRLQGFPDGYKPTGGYGQTKKQVGNAVPIPVAKAVLAGVLDALA